MYNKNNNKIFVSRIQGLIKKINQTCNEIRNIKKQRKNNIPIQTHPYDSHHDKEMSFSSLIIQRQPTIDNDIIHSYRNNAGTGQMLPESSFPVQSGPSPLDTHSSSSTKTPLPSSSLAGEDSRGGIADAKESEEELERSSSSSESSESDPYWRAMEAKESR